MSVRYELHLKVAEACDMRKGFNGLHALVTEKLAARAVEPDTCLNVSAPPADPTGLRTKVRVPAAEVRFWRAPHFL